MKEYHSYERRGVIVTAERQIGGGWRIVASSHNGRVIEACMDIALDGKARWEFPYGCEDTEAGRTAIREYRSRP